MADLLFSAGVITVKETHTTTILYIKARKCIKADRDKNGHSIFVS